MQIFLNNRTALVNINGYKNIRPIGWFRVNEWNQGHEFFPYFDLIIHHANAILYVILTHLECLPVEINEILSDM